MNEPAIRLEEQIISLFPDRETLVCQGWILKKEKEYLMVYPLYYRTSGENVPENVQKCEEIGRRYGLECVFRIVEHTNYYLRSVLEKSGYGLKSCGVVGEWNSEVLADIPEQGELPKCCEQAGFQKAYSYHIYQKESGM